MFSGVFRHHVTGKESYEHFFIYVNFDILKMTSECDSQLGDSLVTRTYDCL